MSDNVQGLQMVLQNMIWYIIHCYKYVPLVYVVLDHIKYKLQVCQKTVFT